jgi:hypothetical protein
LRADRLDLIDPRSLQGRGPTRWADLAWRRMRADHARVTRGPRDELGEEYQALIDAYDRAGLPVERVVSRLSLAAWRAGRGVSGAAVLGEARGIVEAYDLDGLEADVLPDEEAARSRERRGMRGPGRS